MTLFEAVKTFSADGMRLSLAVRLFIDCLFLWALVCAA